MTHGKRYAYQQGCRCNPCREANSRYLRRWKRSLREKRTAPHGSHYAYSTWGCRCELCRDAHRADQRQERADRKARLAADPKSVTHGRPTTYSQWGCRCEPCKQAKAAEKAGLWRAS